VGVVKLAERHGSRELRASSYPAMTAELLECSPREVGLEPDVSTQAVPSARRQERSRRLRHQARLERYERSRIDGQWLDRDDIVRISDTIVSQDFKGRAAIPCIGTDRADLILPGCAILRAIMDNWPCGTLRVADRGLREGMLIALVRESQSPARSSVRAAN
jgi:exopolyphosphatase/guanosine-5'-triphosphate,3'-diphosphate pyrophosphatase